MDWRFRSVLGVLFLASTLSAARSDDTPDVATLRERIRLADGKVPVAERLTVTYTFAGLNGTRVTVRSGSDFRETTTFGPFATASGSYRGQAWRQNENGQTILQQPDPGSAAREPMEATVTRVTAPIDGYVLGVLNAKGFGGKEYVDGATWHVVRRELIAPTGTTVTQYDDFRTKGGYTRPWHWSVRDDRPENDADYRMTSDDFGPVAAADLAIPPPRRELVTFPLGVHRVVLPAREDRDEFIVRVNVGKRGLDFVLDTGSSRIVLDDDVARELGLKMFGTFSNAANASRYLSSRVIIPEMTVGPLVMHEVVASTIPHLGFDRPGDYKVVGLLGFDFIGALALELDYERGSVVASDYDAFNPPIDSNAIALDVRIGSGQPMASVNLNGALGERFIIDTGNHGTVMIQDYFARRHPEAMVDKGGGKGRNSQYRGVGGDFETKPYQLDAVTLGNVTFRNFVAYRVMTPTAYAGRSDGSIGSDFLKFFTLYLDYADSKIFLEPNAFAREVLDE